MSPAVFNCVSPSYCWCAIESAYQAKLKSCVWTWTFDQGRRYEGLYICIAYRSIDLPHAIRAHITFRATAKISWRCTYMCVVCRKCALICGRSWLCKSSCVLEIVFLRNYNKGERCISVSRLSTELIIIEGPVFVIPLQQHEINPEINPMFRSRVNLFPLVPSLLTLTESKIQHQIAQYNRT